MDKARRDIALLSSKEVYWRFLSPYSCRRKNLIHSAKERRGGTCGGFGLDATRAESMKAVQVRKRKMVEDLIAAFDGTRQWRGILGERNVFPRKPSRQP